MFCVRIDGISNEDLAFFGYDLIAEDDNFSYYRDYHGEEYLVQKSAPRLFIDDMNDAIALMRRSSVSNIIGAPPKD